MGRLRQAGSFARLPSDSGRIKARAAKGIAAAALLACAGCGGEAAPDPSLVPTPVGRGPEFLPASRPPLPALCEPGPLEGSARAHVELFARRRVVVVPAAIGLGRPLRVRHGRVIDARCRAEVRTLEPTGVLELDGEGLRLRDLFRVWREPLGPMQLLSFRGPVSVYVAGRRVEGDPRDVPLTDGAQIVVETGGHVPPHREYRFPPRP
jgi:hypothetical protein